MQNEEKEYKPAPGVRFDGKTPEGFLRFVVEISPNGRVSQHDLEQIYRFKELAEPARALNAVLKLYYTSVMEQKSNLPNEDQEALALLVLMMSSMSVHDVSKLREHQECFNTTELKVPIDGVDIGG